MTNLDSLSARITDREDPAILTPMIMPEIYSQRRDITFPPALSERLIIPITTVMTTLLGATCSQSTTVIISNMMI